MMLAKTDQVIELKLDCVPEASVSGALLLQTEYSTYLTFNAMREQTDEQYVDVGHAVVEFFRCIRTQFGHPNDEALPGHPLYVDGLDQFAYGIFEVLNSSWIREIERQNRVHFPNATDWAVGLRHFIFTFHDSTFECVAQDFKLEVTDELYEQIFARISKRILAE